MDEEASASSDAPASTCEPLHQELSMKVVSARSVFFELTSRKKAIAMSSRAEHKILSEDCESRNSHRCARFGHSVDTILSVSNQNLLRNQKRVHKSFSSRLPSQKSFILTILWTLARLVKSYPEIIVHLRLTIPKQTVLLRERFAESRKELLHTVATRPG